LLPACCQGAHYWLDKSARAAPSPSGGYGERASRAPALDLATVHGALAAAVRGTVRRRRLVAIASKQAFAAPSAPVQGAHAGGRGVPGAAAAMPAHTHAFTCAMTLGCAASI
jgi:hypothetical protein